MQMLAQQKVARSGSITYPQALKIAYLDSSIQLLSILSGFNNLKLAAEYHQTKNKKQIHRRALQLLEYFQCMHVRYKLPAFMSTLEHRLLLIARALMLEPDILFIDKPFQGLDMQEHNVLGDLLMAITADMQITVVSSAISLAFMKKAAQHIIYCDGQAFYAYNEWGEFSNNHPELFDH
jgi:ABC-type multidrug transport system ATPase subunit